MSASHERELYEAWVELLSWMREYAREKGVRFEKEAGAWRCTPGWCWPWWWPPS